MSRFLSCFGKSKNLTKEKNLKSKYNEDSNSQGNISISDTSDPCPKHQGGNNQPTGQVSSHSGTSVQETGTLPSTPNSGSQRRITTENTTTQAQDNPNGQKQPTKSDTHHSEIKQTGFRDSTLDSQRHTGTNAPRTTNRAQENHNGKNEPTRHIAGHCGIQETGIPGTSGDVTDTGNQIQGNASPSIFSMDSSIYPTEGKGLCIIMANFIPETLRENEKLPVLPGYMKDIESLKNLFESETFDFDVRTELNSLPFRNLSSQQFRTSMYNIQQLFKDREQRRQPRYDKFLMFVLSHGGEEGIYMCEEGSDGREEEKFNDEISVIAEEEIINSFTHDRVASLKGIPKCFFFQACRGSGLTHAAAKSDNNLKPDDEEECNCDLKSDEQETLSLPSVTRKNILVAYASLDTKKSYVHSEKGSWFIENLVSVLRKQSERKDIFEMLTEMTALTSTKTKPERFACNSKNCVIKVNWDNQLCPVTVVGKVNDESSNGTDEQHMYRPVLVSSRNTYIGFAQAVDFPLKSYMFRGTISFLQYEGKHLKFEDWVPAQHLNAFENESHFAIVGQLKTQHTETTYGTLKINGNKWKPEPIRPKGKIERVEVEVKHGEESKIVSDTKQLREAFVYINNRLYGSGPFKKDKNGVWGVEVEMYQLPVFTSTLTKQLFLAKLNKRKDVNAIINREVEKRVTETLVQSLKRNIIPKVFADNPDSNMHVDDVE